MANGCDRTMRRSSYVMFLKYICPCVDFLMFSYLVDDGEELFAFSSVEAILLFCQGLMLQLLAVFLLLNQSCGHLLLIQLFLSQTPLQWLY